tara:strand:- start:76 stop:357 length:282 start_codon:yes stop_codon:yes gene_type:complete
MGSSCGQRTQQTGAREDIYIMACDYCGGDITVAETREHEALYYEELALVYNIGGELYKQYVQEQEEEATEHLKWWNSMSKQEQEDQLMTVCYC